MTTYPKLIMKDVLWVFTDYYETMDKFIEKLIKYNEEISGIPFLFDQFEIALNSPKINIQYMYWDDNDEDIIESDFELTANNQKAFTKCELLYKVNNEVFEKLKMIDNHFFEGFQLFDRDNPNSPDVPLYFLLQGS